MNQLNTPNGESRAVAAILGGAVGDALGVHQESFPSSRDVDQVHRTVLEHRSSFGARQVDYADGGPWVNHGLVMKAGEWTDDTALMLCLSDSIMSCNTIDVGDLMKRFRAWWKTGNNSSQGRAVGLGGNIEKAIFSFDPQDPNRLLGGTNPARDAGNGSLMRLAPVPVYWSGDLTEALHMARLQTATTHNVPECLDGSALQAFVIWHGINGASPSEVFGKLHSCPDLGHPEILELTRPDAAWRTKEERQIRTLPGRCLWSLEAALWCVFNTSSFEEAVVKAVNLGGDADTVGSITGQMAGAIHGEIPQRWLDGLRHRKQITGRAGALFRQGR